MSDLALWSRSRLLNSPTLSWSSQIWCVGSPSGKLYGIAYRGHCPTFKVTGVAQLVYQGEDLCFQEKTTFFSFQRSRTTVNGISTLALIGDKSDLNTCDGKPEKCRASIQLPLKVGCYICVCCFGSHRRYKILLQRFYLWLLDRFHPNLTEILLGPIRSVEREMVDLDQII